MLHRSPLTLAACLVLLVTASACGGSDEKAQAPDAAGQAGETAKKTEPPKKTASGGADTAVSQVRDYIERMKAEGSIDTSQDGWKTSLPMFPDLEFSPARTYSWNLDTNHGPIRVEFLPDVAPRHVSNFVYLTELGYFDGIRFHRVIPGFMAQGGDPLGRGSGGPGYKFEGEFDPDVKHDKPGLLSMANAGPGTDGSQFFLTFVATPWLDGKHTVFGEIVDGMETMGELEKRGSRSGQTTEALVIERARITVE